MANLRLNFESGFSQAMKKHRLANLLEIKELLDRNNELDLKPKNLQLLAQAAKELNAFFQSSAGRSREFRDYLDQIENSVGIILKESGKEKLPRQSIRSLQASVQKINPIVSGILKKEMSGGYNNVSS
jgi:hypothetical protein